MEYKAKCYILCKLKSEPPMKKQLSAYCFSANFTSFLMVFSCFFAFPWKMISCVKWRKNWNALYFIFLLVSTTKISTDVWNRIWNCLMYRTEFCIVGLQLWNLSSNLSNLEVYKFHLFCHIRFQVRSWNTRQKVLRFWHLAFRSKSNILLC